MRKQYPLDPRKQPYIEKPKQRIGTAREMKGVGIALFFHETAKIYSAKSSSDTVGVPIFGHCARLHSNTVRGQNSRNSLRQVFGAIVGWKAHNYKVSNVESSRTKGRSLLTPWKVDIVQQEALVSL